MQPTRIVFVALAIALLGVASVAPSARAADAGASQDTMHCDAAGEPGRVRCTVDAIASPGRSITWAEVEVVSVPEFALALRGRFGPQDAALKETARWRFALALASKRTGRGEVAARVRVVECADDKRCFPRESRVTAEIVIGAP